MLTRGPLSEVVPIGNAAMEDRTVIEWDKDDLDALGLLKVDVLGLGMLTCIRKGFALLKAHYGRELSLGTVPRDDPEVYDMLCRADSIGVFQVESRAQMNMLPRLKPRCFYDLVIEVAIVRPGPIQGDMVHPYLRRRCGLEPVDFPAPHPDHGPEDELRQVLGKTMGVPLFQEQAMRLAMVAAKFSGPEANELRRAMATFRRRGTIDRLHEKMVSRMTARGYPHDFAERCFNQIKGFGEYGFPESHAASFAHLVYVSAWLKCHYPAAFAAALLNSQPMGFYAPAQIVRCARDHGVEAREVDVNHSLWDCTLEPIRAHSEEGGVRGLPANSIPPLDGEGGSAEGRAGWGEYPSVEESPPPGAPMRADLPTRGRYDRAYGFALRLGMRQIDGLREDDVKAIVSIRDGIPRRDEPPSVCSASRRKLQPSPWSKGERLLQSLSDVRDLWRRSGVGRATLERLAAADAFRSLKLDRRQALWEVRGLPKDLPLPLFDHARASDTGAEPEAPLPVMPLSEHVVNDYRTLRLSLKAHPMSFLRDRISRRGILTCAELKRTRDGARVKVARRRSRASAAWLGRRRRVHDHRGRDRRRQFGDLAEGAGARTEGGDGRAPRRGPWPHPAPRGHYPCRRRAPGGQERLAPPSRRGRRELEPPRRQCRRGETAGSRLLALLTRWACASSSRSLPPITSSIPRRGASAHTRAGIRAAIRAPNASSRNLATSIELCGGDAKPAMLWRMITRFQLIAASLALLFSFGATPALHAFEQPEAPSGNHVEAARQGEDRDGGGGEPACGGSRPRHVAKRGQRHRRGHRRADGAQSWSSRNRRGSAAAPSSSPGTRRPRPCCNIDGRETAPAASDAGAVSRCRRQAAAAQDRHGERQVRRRPRRARRA